MRNEYLAAVDIGGTKITVCIARYDGIIVKLYQHVRLAGDVSAIPGQADALIGAACGYAGIQKSDIHSVGISTCSPFKMKNGHKAVIAPNLCGGIAKERGIIPNTWMEIPLEKALLTRYRHVRTGNDCVTAAAAEHLFGAGKGEENMVYVTWSTGIGAGLIVDGNVLRGKNENAGHGGHIFIAEDGPQCGCGNFGDLESLTSGTAIAREYGGGATAGEVFAAYRRGEERAAAIVHRAARNFSRGLASFNALLDTRLFIIGGSVFLNNRDILLPLVEKEFFQSFSALSSGVQFLPSLLDAFLGDIAALCLVMPDTWIEKWDNDRPWEHAPQPVTMDNGA